jgi:hypothetical protein
MRGPDKNTIHSPIHCLASKFTIGDGCWEWTASINEGGYGQIGMGRPQKMRKAHRVLYELLVGPIPAGLELDHLCRNRRCVRPSHLEPVTHQENMLRGNGAASANAAKTHCAKGHPFSRVSPSSRRRLCDICERARKKAWRNRQKEKALNAQ